MLKELKLRSIKCKDNYITECTVLDTDNNKKYYVVSQYDELLFATFESSYIDYLLGKDNNIPNKIEGEEYMFFDYDKNTNITRFWNIYKKTYDEVNKFQHRYYINHKYSHLKKPLNNIKYQIINKRSKYDLNDKNKYNKYELEILLLDNNTKLYIYADDINSEMCINTYSILDTIEKEQKGEDVEYIDSIDYISDFTYAKKSKYYDLYLEMEKYRDGYDR